MATNKSKLADALSALHKLQKGGRSVFRSTELSRLHRERLLRQGYLRKVMKGWLLSSGPGTAEGDSTPWFASFWEFVSLYCEDRLGPTWHLAAESSLLIHVEDFAIPRQLLVHSPKAGNKPIDLPFQSSLLAIQPKRRTSEDEVTQKGGLRILTVEATLARLPESLFSIRSREIQAALNTLVDTSRLLRMLLEGSQPVVAGRMAGALRHVGRGKDADEILGAMKAVGHDSRETNPFKGIPPRTASKTLSSPLVARMNELWREMRREVLLNFPSPPGRPNDVDVFLKQMDDHYARDAYHSLSIEGYRVSEELVEKVRAGDWDPDGSDSDSRDAMAARGYSLAFTEVRSSVVKILGGAPAGTIARGDHQKWFRALFAPSTAAGLLAAGDLAGYRGEPVFIRGSRHVPPRAETLVHAMPAFFDLLDSESEPAVLAVLGHWLFGYIHPYRDGNGRMARFLMNTMLAAGGYPWTIVCVEDRDEYLAALEHASVDHDIVPFARFVGTLIEAM